MTVEEIWEFAQEKGYDTFVATKGKTPQRTIGAKIYVDIRDNNDQPFIKIDSKLRKFFLKELASEEDLKNIKRLSTSFGIGIIKIDIEDPDSSEILFPAKFKTELDWDTINKLTEENDDFKEFIKRIKNDLSSREVRKEKYDQVYNAEKLKEMIKK